jgi:large subunit ribosomal protein L25
MSISLDDREVNRVLASISSTHLINLDVDGEGYTTLIRDRQRHPVSGSILHIDFYEVSMTEKLTTDVNIIIRGEAPAAKNLGGILVTGQETLEVECLPQDLPERFDVDISNLEEIGDTIYVRDISIPPEVDLLTDPDEMVIVVTTPAAEEEEVVEEVEITEEEPEVIERGKRDEEGEEEGETEETDEE